MVELVMRKRTGATGEWGLFVDSPVFEDDFQHIKGGVEVKVVATTPRSLRQLKFAWALATKVAEACDWLDTKEDAMDCILIEARHFRRIFDPRRQIAILRPKPTNFGAMDGTQYTRLLGRMKHAIVTQILPNVEWSSLVAEIEAMIGPDITLGPTKGEVVGSPETGVKQTELHVAPVDSPPLEDRPATSKKKPGPAARASQPRTQEAEAAVVEGQEPVHHGDANLPTTAEEYVSRARQWISKQRNHQVAVDYFDSAEQIALRAACKLSVGQNKMLHRELAQHFEAANVNS